MKNTPRYRLLLAFLISTFTLPGLVTAQQFQSTLYGDTILGFRKPGVGTYELVVNIGNITNFENQAAGTTANVTNFTASQLTAAFSSGYGNLSWSVSAAFQGTFGSWAGYQAPTLWYTLPRANSSTQTVPPTRSSTSAQGVNRGDMLGVINGASSISTSLGASNANNTPYLVREPVWDGVAQIRNDYTYFIDNTGSGPDGSYGLPAKVENKTPAAFTTAVRSDLYRSRPTGALDPDTGSTTGNAYYVGYFTFNPNGSMTFTRAAAGTTPTPPPPPVLTITRAAGTSKIYFGTTNGGTYTLYFTNSTGLTRATTNWPFLANTITGNGQTNFFSDTTADANRFYRVIAK